MRSWESGLIRLPVTEKIAGSNPVGRAKLKITPRYGRGFATLAQLVRAAVL